MLKENKERWRMFAGHPIAWRERKKYVLGYMLYVTWRWNHPNSDKPIIVYRQKNSYSKRLFSN